MAAPNLDQIHIHDLQLRCIVGVFEDEREDKQDLLINITLFADLGKACESDALEDTVDYKAVKKSIVAMVEASSFKLIERLAGEIANICLSFPQVEAVRVRIEKPGALRFARASGVEIYRKTKRF